MDPWKKLEKQSILAQREWEELRDTRVPGGTLMDEKGLATVTAALHQCTQLIVDARANGEIAMAERGAE